MKFDSSALRSVAIVSRLSIRLGFFGWPTALALFPHGGNLAVVIRPALGGRRAALLSHRLRPTDNRRGRENIREPW